MSGSTLDRSMPAVGAHEAVFGLADDQFSTAPHDAGGLLDHQRFVGQRIGRGRPSTKPALGLGDHLLADDQDVADRVKPWALAGRHLMTMLGQIVSGNVTSGSPDYGEDL